jgi:hypothetical protein
MLSEANVGKCKIESGERVAMISTLVADPEPQRRRTRLSRPPQFNPPYNDERHLEIPSPRRAEIALPASLPPREVAVPARPTGPTSARAALAYVRLCIEVVNGFRPTSHLRRITGPVEFTTVIDQLRRRRNSVGHFGPAVAAAVGNRPVDMASANRRPLCSDATAPHNSSSAFGQGPARSNASTQPAPVSLTRLRVSEPLEGIAEAVAVLSFGGRSCGLALRLERSSDSWICSVAQVV